EPTELMTSLPGLAGDLAEQLLTGFVSGQPRPERHCIVKIVGGLVRLRDEGRLCELAEAAGGPLPLGPDPFEASRELLNDGERCWGDVSGGWLNPVVVQEARKCEVGWLRRQEVREKRPLQERRGIAGTNPIKVLWIDANKGDDERPDYRSRIVVREKRGEGEEAPALPSALLFFAMPPLGAVKIHGARSVCMELPEQEQDGIHCGSLAKSSRGIQDESAIWQRDCAWVLQSDGHVAGRARPALFYNSRGDCRSLVRRDDFCALGDNAALDQIEKTFRSKSDLRATGNFRLGTGEEQGVIFLIRVLRVTGSPGDERFEIEADLRRAEMIANELGLGGCSTKSLDTPGENECYAVSVGACAGLEIKGVLDDWNVLSTVG
ncbi:unnamed protein product, partial [Prorocentrum cordatum]